MKTMICLVLDRSGSMSGREKDVIGGVNTFITEQQALPDPASIAFVRFDTEGIDRFRSMGPLSNCNPLVASEYIPRGGTPLLDAVGQTITKLDDDWLVEQPDNCIMMIVTDGEENSSKEYTKDKIKAMIEAREKSGKWAFIYLGANVDAFKEASAMGISYSNTANYSNTAVGTATMYSAASASVSMKRMSGDMLADTTLGGDIEEDGTTTKAPAPQSKSQAKRMSEQMDKAVSWTPPTTSTPEVWTPPVA